MTTEFFNLGIQAFLEADERPTIVFDCQDSTRAYSNAAFYACTNATSASDYARFQKWAAAPASQGSKLYVFAGLSWQCFQISGRWNVVASREISYKESQPSNATLEPHTTAMEGSCVSNVGLDMTSSAPPVNLSVHLEFIRGFDWGSTPLGPMESWSEVLRAMFNMIMADSNPGVLLWGKDLTVIYNEAFVEVAGSKHPELAGALVSVAWAEVWDHFNPIFNKGWATGHATKEDAVPLFISRSEGATEETYMNFTIIPVVNSFGVVEGFYEKVEEVTGQVISQRRMNLLLQISQQGARAESSKDYWKSLLESFEPFRNDVPFAILYSLESDVEKLERRISDTSDDITCWLEGTVGVPSKDLDAVFDGKADDHHIAQLYRKTEAAGDYFVLDENDDCWPLDLIKQQDTQRGCGDICRQATVHLLRPSSGAKPRGLLVIGLSRRQPYDENHQKFRNFLSRQTTSSLATTVLFEDEIRENQRRVKNAASEKALLSKQLLQRTRDTAMLEKRFENLASASPVGICILKPSSEVFYANEKWYQYAGLTQGDLSVRWQDHIYEEDAKLVDDAWHTLVHKHIPVTTEFRYKSSNPAASFTWLLSYSYPELSDDGTLLSVVGTLTDITQMKLAEQESGRKASEALEAKRQQEEFMDLTSHEIRNPLNAILQCADSIVTSLTDLSLKKGGRVLRDSIDAAETIVHCAEHQKRIVDDILTLSKLDANLLNVAPVPFQPIKLVQHAQKMFQMHARNANINLRLELSESLAKLNIDWVTMDSSRVLQIIINLVTNAIKFTKSDDSDEKGFISIGLTASNLEPRADGYEGLRYFPSKISQDVCDTTVEEPAPNSLFLSFSVRDTGKGLSDEEQKLLFNRFSQASPRTHVKYGGSGLGLYISRQLTELQGGKIGLSSRPGKGSLFVFYIKVDRIDAQGLPQEEVMQDLSLKTLASPDPGVLFADWLSNASVLIVEDNLINSKVLVQRLKPVVRETHVANNGVEALEFIRTTNIWKDNGEVGKRLTVVLMDWEMPVMDGITATQEIRDLESRGKILNHTLVVGITANARVEQIQKAKDVGMDDVLTKPFLIKDLKDILERVFQASQAAKSAIKQ